MSKLVRYKIDEIVEVKFERTDKENNFSLPGDECEVTLTLGIQIMPESSQIGFHFDITYFDKRDREKLLFYKAQSKFGIWDFPNTFEIKPDNSYDLPTDFLTQALSISIGAIRGMLIKLNEGTYLDKIYLPIFNPLDFINNLRQISGVQNQAEKT